MRCVRPGRAQGRPYDHSGTSVESRASRPSTRRHYKSEPGSREIRGDPVARIPTIVRRRRSIVRISSEMLHVRFSDDMRSSHKLNATSGVKPIIWGGCDHYFVLSFLALDAVNLIFTREYFLM